MIEVSVTKWEGDRSRWRRLTLALVGGHVAASFMFFLIAAMQTPGLDPPPETAALFIVVTTAGIISYQLLRMTPTIGYPAAMLTGGLVFVILGLVVTGAYGPIGSRTNPIGPVSYAALGVALIVTAGVGWRRGGVDDDSSASQSMS